jgi:phosphatidylserine/phosphatidylglycerophosphate/cardiolipin synthase-like enzyme
VKYASLTLVALLALTGCIIEEEEIDGPVIAGKASEPNVGPGGELPAGAIAGLDLHALDVWGRPLDAATAKLSLTADGQTVDTSGFPHVSIALHDRRQFALHLEAEGFRPLDVTITFDGTADLHALVATAPNAASGAGIAVAHAEGAQPRHAVFLGLRHKWFSAQARPPRAGNAVELYRSGEDAWQSARTALDASKKSVLASTWWFESDAELTRDLDQPYQTADERKPNTMMAVLEKTPAYKRVLVGDFVSQDGILQYLNTDAPLRNHGKVGGDDFEYMGQVNPSHGKFQFTPKPVDFAARVHATMPDATAMAFDASAPVATNVPAKAIDLTQWPVEVDIDAASYHQKFLVVDHDLAFVGGMNIRNNDWDTTEHEVFDYRRMKFGATEADRAAVMNKEKLPDNGPRKDYMMRIDGPAAQDVADVFHERWQLQLDSKVQYSQNASPFTVVRDIPERSGGLTVQITTTMPEPFYEVGIAESWFNAIDNAEEYIYIEDQYFRAPMLNERIIARMKARPNLRLVVITKPINEWADPGCAWTYLSNTEMANAVPGRYLVLQLRAFDTSLRSGVFVVDETKGNFADFDVHSKMLIVDDVFMSVGSANKNNRGMVYEGEMNVAVADAAYVKAERRAILAEILPPGTKLSDDSAMWFEQLQAAALANDAVYTAWDKEGGDLNLNGAPLPTKFKPRGFLYSLKFGSIKDCLMESVGPDMTSRSR